MDKATIFTIIEGKIVGIFVESGGKELGHVLLENYPTYDDAISIISLGAAKKIGSNLIESVFYTPISMDVLSHLQRWEADSIAQFMEKYALEYNYFYDSIYNTWFLMYGPNFYSDIKQT